MKFFGDYHTHSRYSDGRQTIPEIALAAEKRGLQEVAVTDHGPHAAVIGVKNEKSYLQVKQEVKAINETGEYNVELFVGAEANIRDLAGSLDISYNVIKELDVLIAGLHPYTLPTSIDDGLNIWLQNSLRHLGKAQKAKAKNANTKASCEALYRNPEIEILSHPGLFFDVDYEEVARACIKNDVLFEINCGHEHPGISDIMMVERTGVDFIIDSDAHFTKTVGQLSYGESIIKKLGIDPARVVNCWDGGEETHDSSSKQFTCTHHYRFIGRRQNANH